MSFNKCFSKKYFFLCNACSLKELSASRYIFIIVRIRFGIVRKILLLKAIPRECSIKKLFLENLQKIHRKISMPESPKNLAQMLSCEFCDNFKNSYFVEHIQAAVSYILQYPYVGISSEKSIV